MKPPHQLSFCILLSIASLSRAAPTRKPTPKPTRKPTTRKPTRKPTANGCCSWDYGNCGTDPWCSASKANCAECTGFYIFPNTQVGCHAMWTDCDNSADCCGPAQCLVQADGWRHCNLPENLVIGPDNNSERITLPRPPTPLGDTAQQINCPHDQPGLVNWISLPAPVAGQAVNLPANARVVIRQSITTTLGVVDIPPSSELIIGGSTNTAISLSVGGFNVRGKLTVGSETCRIQSKVTITLRGNRPADPVTSIPSPTFKGISVTGTLSLHGKRFYHTWTRLSKTAWPRDTSLRLQEDVNWEAGQTIILVSTAMKDSKEWHQNEVLTVQSVDNSPDIGSIVYLQSAIQYKHTAIQAYQAEVGLLTRNIVVQGGATDSFPKDSSPRLCMGRWIHGNTDEPCPNKDLTGFGGHIIIQNPGKAHVEGVELFRMGQTNVLGRYPIHFHLLKDCPTCYFRDSSVHKSFYRCISIHGTDYVSVSENVAFDVTGYCYYLEDGVEEYNKFRFNLAAHIHMIGPGIPHGDGQTTQIFQQSKTLTNPADVTASGFYITNIRNELIGNAASGGWAGFAFPNLKGPLGLHRSLNMRPSSVVPLDGDKLNGNSAHSTGWWWHHASAFYFGGALYYNGSNVLEYNPGRSFDFEHEGRDTCYKDLCGAGDCRWCPTEDQAFVRITNSKAFLTQGDGLNCWAGRMEIQWFECHDCGISIEALGVFWMDNMSVTCRTGEPLQLPPGASAGSINANGFFWYDTGQEHIMTNTKFRNCGSKVGWSGCDTNSATGCEPTSSVFSFLTHSSEFNPEIMQGTRAINFEDCGRRFYMSDFRGPGRFSVSGRLQNWLDEDGSVTGLWQRSVIASALDNGMWWKPDKETVYNAEGPVYFFKLTSGPQRDLGHVTLRFDDDEHAKVGSSVCTNGGEEPCPALGYIKHVGPMFASDAGLAVTAQPDIAGPVGGFGWLLKFNRGSPRRLRIQEAEIRPDTPLMLYIAYPPDTTFDIYAYAPWCWDNVMCSEGCKQQFVKLNSIGAVRNSLGNAYSMGADGLLTIRVVQFDAAYIGEGTWFLPDYNDLVPSNTRRYVLDRFERGGVFLPAQNDGTPHVQIIAKCGGTGTYCSQLPPNLNPNPCSTGFQQVAYDKCCSSTQCICANGKVC